MIIDCAIYDHGVRRAGNVDLEEAFRSGMADDTFVWIGLYEPSVEEFESVQREFDLHPLAVEDAISAHQRPKLEVYGDSLFVVLKTARYVDPDEIVELGEILLFLGPHFVVAVRHGEASALAEVRRTIEEKADLLKCGPGAVLHAIVDRVVDDYAPVLRGLDNDIDEIEKSVFSDDRDTPTERIYRLKREVLEFHQATSPLIEPLYRLSRQQYEHIDPHLSSYFRDVHDHLLRVVDRVTAFRDLLTSVLDANLTQVSVRQNEDMRKISAWVAIAALPTMLAGIYGMNFEHMPELDQTWGYPAVLAVMVVACLFLYRYFRRSGWL